MTTARKWAGSGAAVGGGLVLWSLGNWLFFVLAGRILGPSDYGTASAILSGCLVVFVLCGGLQPAIAASNRGRPPDAIFARAIRLVLLLTVIGLTLLAITCLFLGAFVTQFPSTEMFAAVSVLSTVAIFPLTQGQLQGAENFQGYSIGYVSVGIARPIMFVLLWLTGMHTVAAILGTALSWVIGSAVICAFAIPAFRSPPIARTAPEWMSFRRALVPNTVGTTAIAVFTNADVITAKLVLPSAGAGFFAAASTISQGLFLVPQVLATLVVPRLAARKAQGASSAHFALIGALITLGVGLLFSLMMVPLGPTLMAITYGEKFRPSGALLPYYGFAMAFMGCVIILLYHQITRRDFRFSWMLITISFIQVGALIFVASSPNTIISIDLICALIAIATHELLAKRDSERLVDGVHARPPNE